MSSQTTNMQPPIQQWQNFAQPYMYDPSDSYKVIETINGTERNITAGVNGISKDISQKHSLDGCLSKRFRFFVFCSVNRKQSY